MTKRILYQTDDGGVAVIIPTNCGLTVRQIADKDVPTGKPFRIVDGADIPTDRSQRGAWVVDPAGLTDGVGEDYGAGSNWDVIDYVLGKPVLFDPKTETAKYDGVEYSALIVIDRNTGEVTEGAA